LTPESSYALTAASATQAPHERHSSLLRHGRRTLHNAGAKCRAPRAGARRHHPGLSPRAVARGGGMVATASLGSVLAATGPELLSAFHAAMIVGAATCAAASLSAFGLLDRQAHLRDRTQS